jgi:hypothetical protein
VFKKKEKRHFWFATAYAKLHFYSVGVEGVTPIQPEAYFINPASFLIAYRSLSFLVEIYWYGLIKYRVSVCSGQPTTQHFYTLMALKESPALTNTLKLSI